MHPLTKIILKIQFKWNRLHTSIHTYKIFPAPGFTKKSFLKNRYVTL